MDSNVNILIPKDAWVNIYAVSGIPVGTAIAVENIGVCDVYLTVQQEQPEKDHDAYNIVKRHGLPMRNTQGDSGAWAFCNGNKSKISVRPL